MSKYNYFDDEPEELEPKKRFKINIDFKSLAINTKQTIESLVHGDTLKEIYQLPNLRTALLKLLALVLFLLFILIFIVSFSHSINAQNEKNSQFAADAGKVCTNYITQYGTGKWVSLDSSVYGKSMARLTGLCYARQMDFDNDGNDELMLCYNDGSTYTLEVWGYVKDDFTKIYSEPANSTTDTKDGFWIAFYYKSNKYYICKSDTKTPEKVELLALKGDSFKKSSECDYDYKNNIYSIKGTINADDFETIKLSVIKASRAELIIDTATNNIDSFNTISMPEINNQLTDEQRKAAAYYDVIESRTEKYGKAKVVSDSNGSYIDGLAYVDLIDFNNDGNNELVLVYRKLVRESATNAYSGERITIENPTYCVEVYSWNGTISKKIFTKDSISNYLEDDSVNYLMLHYGKNNTVSICTNSYNFQTSYTYTATSRIYEPKDNGFDTTFSAKIEDNYGYRSYYLNGEYSYRSNFESSGYQVPKFMNDDESCDSEKYKLIYVSGSKSNNFDATIADTVKVIQQLDSSYSPND